MMDEKDKRILETLEGNAKLTTSQISKKLNIPVTTVHNRIKKLESEGVIKGYTLVLDYEKLEKGIFAFTLATVNYIGPEGKRLKQEDIARQIRKLNGVESVHITAGISDLLVKVRVKDINELNEIVTKKMREISGVDKTQTMIVLNSF